jgi:PST family polysaccharide transporter
MNTPTDFKTIFKSTFLFGFVQVFNILTKLLLQKVVALFLGSEGVGTIGIYHTTINLLKPDVVLEFRTVQ